MKKIKVLIVDRSADMRKSLAAICFVDPLIKVIGVAGNPFAAAGIIKEEVPDVILLDIDTPGMDGLIFLQKIMTQHPMPVIIMADITAGNAAMALKAMEYGAADVINRKLYTANKIPDASRVILCDTIKAAAGNIDALSKRHVRGSFRRMNGPASNKVIVIGASTGGTKAIEVLLENLTPDTPGIVIVQHMKEYFTMLFAQRLNDLCGVVVKEAGHMDEVIKGRVLIAPGDRHILLKKNAGRYFVELAGGPLVSRHRPSVDVLFQSAADNAGKDAIGIILTGMGCDGAKGLLKMKEAGAVTIAQDEKTSVVFGMPGEAVRLQAAEKILPLHEIARYLTGIPV